MTFSFTRIWKRLWRIRSDSDLEAELRVHLELAAEENSAGAIPDMEARRRAQLQLGHTRRSIIESMRDQDLLTVFESFYRDLVLGFRELRKSPVFCLTAILTLALGIGANTAVFSVLYGLLLRSLPVKNPQQLVHLGATGKALRPSEQAMYLSYRMFQQFSRHQHSFTEVSAWTDDPVTSTDREGTMRRYPAALVSANAFATLQLKPHIGRFFEPSDDLPTPPSSWPVVLGYRYWKSRFAGDPTVIGQQIRIEDRLATITGVTPENFQGIWPGTDIKMYLPFQFLNVLVARDIVNTPDSMVGCAVIARLKSGVSIRDAGTELAVDRIQLLDTLPTQFRHSPDFEKAGFAVQSARTGLPTFLEETYSGPLFLLEGLVAIVLILCCLNVGGLMIAKLYSRQREFAVRIALGAARWRLIRQYLTESLMIAVAGALLGAAGAWYGAAFLLRFFRHPNMFESLSVAPDASIFWLTGGLAVVTTLVFGSLPAWRAGRSDPGILLKSRSTLGGRRHIAGRAFVPIQVALSIALVALASLLSESLIHLRGEPTGFDLNHVTIQTPPGLDHLKGTALLDTYQKIVDRVAQTPGIYSAAVTWYTPMTGDQATAHFQAEYQETGGSHRSIDRVLALNAVGPAYFRTMRIPILSGREFAKNEREDTECVVNESAASYLFPGQLALGQFISSTDKTIFDKPMKCRIIGIAKDAKFANLQDAPPRTIYFPVTNHIFGDAGGLVFLINSQTKAEAIAAYRQAIKEIAPSTPLVLFVTLREQMDAALGSQRLITAMSSFFAAVAVLLSALGLYGLLSSNVEQRTAEIGVRVALGARRSTMLQMIIAEALRLLVFGALAGAVVLVFAIPFVRSMLYEVSAFDPLTLAGTLVLLTAVTLLAGFWPALRAASLDPVDALRIE